MHGLLALDGEASVGFRGKMAADRRDAVLAAQFAGVRLIGIILGIVFAAPCRRRGCVCRHLAFENSGLHRFAGVVQFVVHQEGRIEAGHFEKKCHVVLAVSQGYAAVDVLKILKEVYQRA